MTASLRRRIHLTVAPLVLLILGTGAAGVYLLNNLGRRSDDIIRENYVSLAAMADVSVQLAGAERIALAGIVEGDGLHPTVIDAFDAAVDLARESCRVELNTITIPGEAAEAAALAAAVEEVSRRGRALLRAKAADRRGMYYAPGTGLQAAFKTAESHAAAIRVMNEAAMYAADEASRRTARRSTIGLGVGVAASLLFAGAALGLLGRTILRPIHALTDGVRAIRSGDLTHRVPEARADELGELAAAFNDMAEQLWLIKQTSYRQLARARETAQATIDSFPSPVLVLDPEGRVELANPAAKRLFGVAVSSAKAGPPWLPPDALRGPVATALRDQRPALTDRFDQAVTLRPDGVDRAYLPQVRPIRGDRGDTLGVAVVLDDVTQFRLMDQLKGDFVATAGHELKTPLTGLRMAVHLLLEEAVGPLNAKQTELLLDARENAERLFATIEQLLALARLEDDRQAVAVVACDAGELLRHAADEASVRAGDKQLSVVVTTAEGVPAVAADPVRFGHALNNLVTNAITYTPTGGTITLAADAVGDRVRLTVADTGVGIPPEHLPQVFERFFRVPGESNPPGTGLGLAIVKEVVTAHGGEITCESAVGVGTTFRITLPAWQGNSP